MSRKDRSQWLQNKLQSPIPVSINDLVAESESSQLWLGRSDTQIHHTIYQRLRTLLQAGKVERIREGGEHFYNWIDTPATKPSPPSAVGPSQLNLTSPSQPPSVDPALPSSPEPPLLKLSEVEAGRSIAAYITQLRLDISRLETELDDCWTENRQLKARLRLLEGANGKVLEIPS